jgi:hypothetical protein
VGAHLAFDLAPRPRETDGSTGSAMVAVRWVEADGATRWRVPLPLRMAAATIPMGDAEAAVYRRATYRYDLLASLLTPGVLPAGDAILIAHTSGLLALGATDGTTRLDWSAPPPPAHRADALFFDSARVEAKRPDGSACTAKGRSGAFLMACGPFAIWFDGAWLAVFDDAPWRLAGKTRYDRALHDAKSTPPGVVRSRLAAAGVTVSIDGAIFLD